MEPQFPHPETGIEALNLSGPLGDNGARQSEVSVTAPRPWRFADGRRAGPWQLTSDPWPNSSNYFISPSYVLGGRGHCSRLQTCRRGSEKLWGVLKFTKQVRLLNSFHLDMTKFPFLRKVAFHKLQRRDVGHTLGRVPTPRWCRVLFRARQEHSAVGTHRPSMAHVPGTPGTGRIKFPLPGH